MFRYLLSILHVFIEDKLLLVAMAFAILFFIAFAEPSQKLFFYCL